MSIYHSSEPYIYAIGWTQLDRWYLGVRFSKSATPDDLWTTYFTSSKYVAEFRAQHGEPDHIEVLFSGTKDDVCRVEYEAIKEYRLHMDDRWLNRNAGGTAFNITGHKRSEETRLKMSAARKGKPFHGKVRGKKRYCYKGENLTIHELATIAGVCPNTIRERMRKGDTLETAVDRGRLHQW